MSHAGIVALLAAALASTVALALEQGLGTCDPVAPGDGSCTMGGDHAMLQRRVKQAKALATDSPLITSGDQIFLTAFTGKQITVQEGRVHAKWNDRHDWQTFVIEKDAGGVIEDGDSVFIKAHTGNYLTVEGQQVHAYWENERGSWQQFVVEKERGRGNVKHNDVIFLRAHTGNRITVMPEGDVDVHASWDHQGEWQGLTIEKRTAEAAATTTAAPVGTTGAAPGECAAAWQQCGGNGHPGPACCVEGYYCHENHEHYSQCLPAESETSATTTAPSAATTRTTAAPTTASTTAEAATTAAPTAPATSTPAATAAPSTTTQGSAGTAPPVDGTWTTGTWTTGYWDCCKPSCSWPGKGNVDRPVRSCQAGTGFPLDDPNEGSVCQGGGSATSCANNQPWAYSANLSFGFAAAAVSGSHGLTGDDNCGQCYELRFAGGVHQNGGWGGSHPMLVGKTMVIQVTNIGYDVAGEHSFDLQIPGAGQGAFSDGCTAQFSGFSSGDFDCDNLYGGCHEKAGCDRLPLDLQAGCQWRYEWYHWLREGGQSNNPFVDFRRVRCPEQIIAVTGSTPNDDGNFPEINLADYA